MASSKEMNQRKANVEALHDLWDIAHERFGPGSKECKDIEWCLKYWERHGKPHPKMTDEQVRMEICGYKNATYRAKGESIPWWGAKKKGFFKFEKGEK